MKEMHIDDYDAIISWSYSLAKKWVQDNLIPQGVTSKRKFEQYKQDGYYLPKYFPRIPDEYFKRRGSWQGWRNFFGYPEQKRGKHFVSYKDASRIAKMHRIKNCKEYRNWESRPANLPARPELYYEEWTNWKDFLGNQYEKPKLRNASKLSISDIRIIKHQLKLGIPGSVLARTFGVSEMQISRIKKEENWSDI